MTLFYLVIFFIIGILLGNIYNCLGKFLVIRDEDNLKYLCPSCRKEFYNLPLVAYFMHGGRCPKCKKRLDLTPAINELFTGILFALSFYVFGFSYELFICLGIVSLLTIIIVSDITYLVIPDEVLITVEVYFLIVEYLMLGLSKAGIQFLYGLFLFGVMYLIMLIGDFFLKKESLGGGDIKMMVLFGTVLGPANGLFAIFLGSLLALPISIDMMVRKNYKEIPFGPFLLIAFLLMYLLRIDVTKLLTI